MNKSNSVSLEEIQIADTLIHYNIDNIIWLIEESNDNLAIRQIIKFLRLLRSKLPSRNSSDQYWDLDEGNLLYLNQTEFNKVVNEELKTIPVGAVLHSEISHKGGFGALLIKAHDSTDRFIELLKELAIELNQDANNKETNINLSQNEKLRIRKVRLKKIYTVLEKHFFISCGNEEFTSLESTKKIDLTHSKTDLFPKELFLYQASILISTICEIEELLKYRIEYRIIKTKSHFDIVGYKEAKREISKYQSSLKKRKIPDNYTSFKATVNLLFAELNRF